MPTTTLGITYPDSTDAVRVWEDMQTLAEDVDGLIAAKGFVAEDIRTSSSGTFTTSETVVQSLTWTAVSTVRYKITAVQSLQSSVANDNASIRLRYASGASVTSGGAQLRVIFPNLDVANKGQYETLVATVTGLSGQHTVGVTAVRSTGTGTLQSFGSAGAENYILIEGI